MKTLSEELKKRKKKRKQNILARQIWRERRVGKEIVRNVRVQNSEIADDKAIMDSI